MRACARLEALAVSHQKLHMTVTAVDLCSTHACMRMREPSAIMYRRLLGEAQSSIQHEKTLIIFAQTCMHTQVLPHLAVRGDDDVLRPWGVLLDGCND